MFNRHNDYNKALEDIKEMEKNNEVFVIRPSKPLSIKLNETNPEKLQEIYDLGVENCKKIIKKLKKYLEE